MSLVSVLKINNRWKVVFGGNDWKDIPVADKSFRKVIKKFSKGADAILDLGEVVLARFDKDSNPAVAGLSEGVEIGVFKQEAPVDIGFTEKCLNMANFIQGYNLDNSSDKESGDGKNTVPMGIVMIETPVVDNAKALSVLVDPASEAEDVKEMLLWLDNAVKTPKVNGLRLSYGRIALWSPMETAFRLATQAAVEMNTRVSIAVGGKGVWPGMLWSAVVGLMAMQRRRLSGQGSFDWTIVRGNWDPDLALSRYVPSDNSKPGTTMRPYPVKGEDVGSLAWFLKLAEDVRSSRVQEVMSAGLRYGSAVARQAMGPVGVQLDKYGIGQDGYVTKDKVRITPVFDLAEFMEINEAGGIG